MTFLQCTLSGMLIALYAFYSRRNPYIWFMLGYFWPVGSLVLLCVLPLLKKLFKHRLVVVNGKNPSTQSRKRARPRPKDDTVTVEATHSYSLHASPEDTSKLWYFLNADNETIGPMSFQAFYFRWKEGHILDDSFVWNDTFSEWKSFKEAFPSARK